MVQTPKPALLPMSRNSDRPARRRGSGAAPALGRARKLTNPRPCRDKKRRSAALTEWQVLPSRTNHRKARR